jgi:peptidoglycan hydrolase-like protein with peptidoglycan-binding domain
MTTFTGTETPQHRSPKRTHRGFMAASIGICSIALAATGLSVGLGVAAAAAAPVHTTHVHTVKVLSVSSVKHLQTQLASLNYYEGAIDGIYGPKTTAAVTYLQRDAGLAQTGTMNAATEAALARFMANGNNQMHPTTAATQSVKTLQKDLGLLNYYEGPIDGISGPQTKAAIADLQRDAGLPQTGTMNPATQAALQKFLAHGNSQMNPGPLTTTTTVVPAAS